MSYAAGTSVPVYKTQGEIQILLDKFGATQRSTAEMDRRALVAFVVLNRKVLFEIPLPAREDFATRMRRGYRVPATPEQARVAYEQACRERWRALFFTLKAKLVALESHVETFEQCFLAHLVVGPEGETVFQRLTRPGPGGTPPMLPPSGGSSAP